jgi:hypothetical protein
MRNSILRTLSVLACLGAMSAPLLLLPMFIADARSTTPAPDEAGRIKEALTQHDAHYVLRSYNRIPLQCASELHGA